MGRSYQAEPSIQEYFDAQVSRKAGVQVGLIVGKQAVGARDVLLHLVQTPSKGDVEPVQVTQSSSAAAAAGSSKGGKKGTASTAASGAAAAASLSLDVEWMEQHAAQVARMLPGGVSLLGCYLFSSELAYLSAVPQLCSMLQSLRSLLPPGASQELLVLHADAGARKVSARSGSGGTSLSPAELKWAPCLPLLMTLSCRWTLQCALPAACATASLLQQLQQVKDAACADVGTSVACLPGGNVPAADSLMMDLPASSPASSPASMPDCHIQLLPLQGITSPQDTGSYASGSGSTARGRHGGTAAQQQQGKAALVCGRGAVQGWVWGCAVVHKRQSWASAIQELKHDLCSTLQTRVELLEEDALSWQEEQAQSDATGTAGSKTAGSAAVHPLMDAGSLSRPYTAALPHRVQIQTALSGLPAFDHLLPGEGPPEAAARAAELLGVAAGLQAGQLEQQVMLRECEPSLNTRLPSWTPLSPPALALDAAKASSSRSKSSMECSGMVLGGAAAGVAAVVAGLALYLAGMGVTVAH